MKTKLILGCDRGSVGCCCPKPRMVGGAGDTHLHTVYSFDAGSAGTLLGPADAYEFALDNQITTDAGQPVKLSRPLDFVDTWHGVWSKTVGTPKTSRGARRCIHY